METIVRQYKADLDVIKAIAIIVVVLYHMGFLLTGYLGVEIFLVVNGFFIIPPLLKNKFKMGGVMSWNAKRLIRLYPLLLIASVICLLIGYYGMLPDDYENLSQSVIASNLFANNILQAITTRNYWDIANDYKPLMHTWYLGILVQFYIAYSLIIWITGKLARGLGKEEEKVNLYVLWGLTTTSLILYIAPAISEVYKFYYLPCRFFEIGIGGLMGYYFRNKPKEISGGWIVMIWGTLLFFLLAGWLPITHEVSCNPVSGTVRSVEVILPKKWMLLVVVALTGVIVSIKNKKSIAIRWLLKRHALLAIGKATLSIFIWHQIVLAFIRLYDRELEKMGDILIYCLFVALLSWLSYSLVEKRIRLSPRSVLIIIASLIIVMSISFFIYSQAGVMRDVPELEVRAGQTHIGMFAEYCDRGYEYDKDFPEQSTKKNVLVEGVSFGRDFVNILLESEIADSINISYVYKFDSRYEKRYKQADLLFLFCNRPDVPDYVTKNMKPSAQMYGIGPKNFGVNNCRIYFHRNSSSYFQSTVKIDEGFKILNSQWKEAWGAARYVDLISVVEQTDGRVRVFTDRNTYISQDCRHLTPEGARFYARELINNKKIRKNYGL